MENKKIKMKGHETFSIREGWLSKGLFEISNDPKLFSKKNLTDILGIGTNMVKSLKYWLLTAGLIVESKKGEYILSELGNNIFLYDPYFEDAFSLFFVHLNIVRNEEKAYIWNLFFNKCNFKNFSKKDIVEQMKYLLDIENVEYNETILPDEISVLLKTYMADEKKDTPENNFTCPLSELNLIIRNGKDNYSKGKPSLITLDKYIVYYCMIEQAKDKTGINIEDLLKKDNFVCKLLNIDKMLMEEYLDLLKNENLITINRTAGLNMIYINQRLTIDEIFKRHFRGE